MRTLVVISWSILPWASVCADTNNIRSAGAHESSGLPDSRTGVALCPLPEFREALEHVLRVSNVTSEQLSIVGGREGVEANYLLKYGCPCAGYTYNKVHNRGLGPKPVSAQFQPRRTE